MVTAEEFVEYLKEKGLTFVSGVPCSILKPILHKILEDKEIEYIPAVRENSALGVASGAYLAGKSSAVLIQNSGLGNVVNALTSFNLIYKIPVLLFVTWRGYEGNDAPEHIIMGAKMLPLLDTLEIPYCVLGSNFRDDIDWAIGTMKTESIPVAVVIRRDIVV